MAKNVLAMIQDSLQGRGIDYGQAPEEPIGSDDEVVCEVSERFRILYSQSHFHAYYAQKVAGDILRSKHDKVYPAGFFSELSCVSDEARVAMILYRLMWQGIQTEYPVCNFTGELAIRNGWKLCRNKKASSALDHPMLSASHVAMKFFSLYERIVSGQHLFDGDPGFLEIGNGSIVGVVESGAIQQLYHMQMKLTSALRALDPYPTVHHELSAFLDKPMSDYVKFIGGRSLITAALEVAATTVCVCLVDEINDALIPDEMKKESMALYIVDGWRIAVGPIPEG